MQCLVLKGHGQAQNAHVAFEVAAERIDKQLRRYMRRLKDKSSPSQPSATLDEIQANASYIVFDAGAEEEEAGEPPALIPAKRAAILAQRDPPEGGRLPLRATQPLPFFHTHNRDHPTRKQRKPTPH